jgi:hypothetical protein
MVMRPAAVTDSEPASSHPTRDERLPPIAATDSQFAQGGPLRHLA